MKLIILISLFLYFGAGAQTITLYSNCNAPIRESFHDTSYIVSQIVWENPINVTIADNEVKKTSSTNYTWDAVTTAQTFADGDMFQFQLIATDRIRQMRIGLGTPTGDTDEDQVQYGLYFFDLPGGPSNLYVQNGLSSGDAPNFLWTTGDYYRVQRKGTFINVYHSLNGTTWATNPLYYQTGPMVPEAIYNLIAVFSTPGIAARDAKKYTRVIN